MVYEGAHPYRADPVYRHVPHRDSPQRRMWLDVLLDSAGLVRVGALFCAGCGSVLGHREVTLVA